MELHLSREGGGRAGQGEHDSFHEQTGLYNGIEDERGCQSACDGTNCGQHNGRTWLEYFVCTSKSHEMHGHGHGLSYP